MSVKRLKRVAALAVLAVAAAVAVVAFCNGTGLGAVGMRGFFNSIVKVTVVGAACAEMAAFLWCFVRK